MAKPTRGQIRERGEGTFELVVSLGEKDDRGRYRRVSRTHHGDEASAAKALKRLVREVDQGGFVASKHMTVETMMRNWYRSEAPHWSPKHAEQMLGVIEQRIIPQFGTVKARDMKPLAIEAWIEQLGESGNRNGSGLSHSYLLKVRAALRQAYKEAVRLEELDWSPMSVVRVRRKQRVGRITTKKTGHLVDDLWPIVEAAATTVEREGRSPITPKPGFAPFLHFALTTGARRGEILALRWSDIDLETGVVNITRGISEVGGVLVEGPPKNDSSVRRIPIDPGTVKMLKAWRKESRELMLTQGGRLTTTTRVWPLGTDRTGNTPWHLDTVSKWWRQLADAIGLEATTLHTCRHAVASTMVAEGTDPAAVAAHLGHVDSSVTLRVYAAASPVKHREAVERLAASVRHLN